MFEIILYLLGNPNTQKPVLLLMLLIVSKLIKVEYKAVSAPEYKHPGVVIYKDPTCSIQQYPFPGSGFPSQTFFSHQICPSYNAICSETLHQGNMELLVEKLTRLIEQNPELEPELLPFLDCNQVELSETFSNVYSAKNKTYLVMLKDSDLNRPKQVVFYNDQEVIYLQAPRDNSKAALLEYAKWLNIYRLPTPVRNLVLKSSKLQKIFDQIEVKIRYSRETFQVIVEDKNIKNVHTFQSTYLGYWRYVGVAERNSYREIFQRNFGMSIV